MGFLAPAEREIRESIERMRQAKLARDVDVVLEATTPDWCFVSGERAFDREGYRAWLGEQLTRFPTESIEAKIWSVELRGKIAEVSLHQTVVRKESDATGKLVRWRLTSSERQEWVRTASGWRLSRTRQWPQERQRLPN